MGYQVVTIMPFSKPSCVACFGPKGDVGSHPGRIKLLDFLPRLLPEGGGTRGVAKLAYEDGQRAVPGPGG